jgi:hypothetical protein
VATRAVERNDGLSSKERVRRYRKWFHHFIGPYAVQKFLPIVEQETHKFLRQLLAKG